MSPLPSRAAALRGDDYQHLIGWYWAVLAFRDLDLESVSIEDNAGGSFDDVVVRRRSSPDLYQQVKSSNYGGVQVDEDWLVTPASAGGRSPLQHFHRTWVDLTVAARPFELALVTNRPFDPADPILGKLRDLKSYLVDVEQLAKAGSSSAAGKELGRWADHLGIDSAELLSFLNVWTLQSVGGEKDWRDKVTDAMRAAGLRDDPDAITIGLDLVRGWVTDGAGPQTNAAIRRQIIGRGLLARAGTLILAVHAIDEQPTPVPPTVAVDLVEYFDGDEPRSRFRLRNGVSWDADIRPRLDIATRQLESYGPRHVHITGSMRLPLWFATGWQLPDTRGWVLSLDQRTHEWSTAAAAERAEARLIRSVDLDHGDDLAVAVALTHDPSYDVLSYLAGSASPVGRLIVLGPPGDPHQNAVLSAGWLVNWVRAAREEIRRAVTQTSARRVHLFMAAPQAAALMLGHHWNLLPTVLVYEYLPADRTYILTLKL